MTTKPSSNWFTLQKSLVRNSHPRKRRKVDHSELNTPLSLLDFPRKTSSLSPKQHESDSHNKDVDIETTEVKNGESIATLRRMVLGKAEYKDSQTTPGKYLALDCEMVGVGIEGNESSLARVSIVNYTGSIILDDFVRQREKVVDYRTRWSGVRSTDLAGSAKSFKEVQETVAEVIKDRVLVGHAVYNDLKALLLSHPSPQIRDTQSLAYKHCVVKSRRPALRVLVKQELGITIQSGEHSSVTDARATMALFRLYKKQFESGFRPFRTLTYLQPKNGVDDDPASRAKAIPPRQPSPSSHCSLTQSRKRGLPDSFESDDDIADEVAQALSPPPRIHSPSPSSVPYIQFSTKDTTTLPKHRKQSKSQPSTGSTPRKGTSSGISEVRAKGMVGNGSVVRNSGKSGNKSGKAGEKWWKSLGGGKKSSIKL